MSLKGRTLACLKLQTRISSFLKFIPYEVDGDTGLLGTFKDGLSQVLWKLGVLTVYAYWIFICARFYQLLSSNDFKTINKIHFAIHLGWVTGFSIPVAGHTCIIHRKQEIPAFINHFYFFMKKTEREMPERLDLVLDLKTNPAELFIQVATFSPFVTVWANFATIFFFPACPAYVTSLFEPDLRDWWPVLVPFSLLEYFLGICIWSTGEFLALHLIAYLRMNSLVLETLMPQPRRSEFDSLESNFRLYRSMQVLNNGFNSSFGPLVMTFGAFSLFATEVVWGVAGMKLFRILPISVWAIFPIAKLFICYAEFAILKMGAQGYLKNIWILDSWKSQSCGGNERKTVKYARRFVESCQPLKVRVGNVTFIKRTSVFLYVHLSFQNTITILLALELEKPKVQ